MLNAFTFKKRWAQLDAAPKYLILAGHADRPETQNGAIGAVLLQTIALYLSFGPLLPGKGKVENMLRVWVSICSCIWVNMRLLCSM